MYVLFLVFVLLYVARTSGLSRSSLGALWGTMIQRTGSELPHRIRNNTRYLVRWRLAGTSLFVIGVQYYMCALKIAAPLGETIHHS